LHDSRQQTGDSIEVHHHSLSPFGQDFNVNQRLSPAANQKMKKKSFSGHGNQTPPARSFFRDFAFRWFYLANFPTAQFLNLNGLLNTGETCERDCIT
jgi:hypothetical protein